MKVVLLFLPAVLAGSLLAQTKPAPAKSNSAAPASKPAATSRPAPGTAAAPKTAASEVNPAVAGDKVVLTVGSEKITEKDFETFVESVPEQYRAQARGPMKRTLAEEIIRVKLLAAEAKRRGIDKDPSTQARVAQTTESVLARAAFNDILEKTNIDEAATRKYYDEHKNEFESVEARHILIKFKGSPVPAKEGKKELTEEEALAKAQEIKKKLQGGEDFATLAKAESDDTGSAEQGGSLGTFQRGQMVPAFEQAAFSLPAGQLSDPIKTQFGYHLIRVEKHDTKSFEQVRPELEKRLKPELARSLVENLRKSSTVVFDEAFFGPERPAAAPATAAPAVAPAPASPPAGK